MATKKQDPEQTPPPPDNVDQIREILFGQQIRAVDERFQSVEKRMSRESDNLRKNLEKRMHELEELLDKFRDNAGDQLNRESAERDASLNEVTKSLATFRLDAENQLSEMQSDFNNEIKEVRAEVLAGQKALTKDLASLQAAQNKRSDQLDVNKVDRGELANFLSDIAGRLAPTTKKRSK